MRRKSERNKSKSSEKKEDTSARKSRRTSRRRKRSTSHSSSDGSDDAPLIKPTVVETPEAEISPPSDELKKSTSNSDEEKQEQPIWKVKTSESPSGEIQKLKICLQRPSTTPERTEKSPRRRRAKASSQSDDAYLTPDEKPQQQPQSRRKLRRGSPPVNKDDGELKVIKGDNDEGKGKLECSQRRQRPENKECVQDSEVNKSLGPSELSNDIPQEEDIKSTTSKDERIIKIDIATPECKDTQVETSPPIKTQDSAIEPNTTSDSKHTEIELIVTPKSNQSEIKDYKQSTTPVESSPKTESVEDKVESSPIIESKKDSKQSSTLDEVESSPITFSIKGEIDSSPIRDSIKCEVESSPIIDSIKCEVESFDIKTSPTKSVASAESSQNESESYDQVSVDSSPKKHSEKLPAESSPSKDSQISSESYTPKKPKKSSPSTDSQTSSESHTPKKTNESNSVSVESSTKTDSDIVEVVSKSSEVTEIEKKCDDSSKEPEVADEVKMQDKIEKFEVDTIKKEQTKMENKDEDNKGDEGIKVHTVENTERSESIIIKGSEEIESEKMNIDSEENKEDLEKISETIKRDLNRTSERMDMGNDDSDKSEPEEKIVISEDEDTKTEKSATPPPETQQVIRPLHRRKWGKYSAKLRSDERLTLESITAIYPHMKLVAEEDLKFNVEEPREVLRPVRKEREMVALPRQSPKEEDAEKEVSNIGLNRKISIVNDEASKLQPPPSPPKHPVSSILYITNLVRPFTLKQLKELLSRTGKILEDGFWTDRIKSRCYVQYEIEEEAEATRNALHGVQWPIGNGKKLMIDFGLKEAMEAARNAVETPVAAVKVVPEKNVEKVPELVKKEQQHIKEDDRWDKKRAAAPTREWDLGKVPQDQRERSTSRDRPRSRSVRSGDKRRHPRQESPSNGDQLSPRKKKKDEQTEVKLMDDLFRKTKATPSIYWLPLTPDQIAKKQQQRLQRMAEHKRRMEESTRRVPSRDFGRGAPRSRRRSDRYNAD